jgi:DNA-directed RNA polymerase specialized sigma24 family protein
LRWAPAWIEALPDVTPPGDDDGYAQLIEIVEALPPTQLVVINGLYWERVSQGLLAQRLGVSQQAVGRRHGRALARIRRALNGGQHP